MIRYKTKKGAFCHMGNHTAKNAFYYKNVSTVTAQKTAKLHSYNCACLLVAQNMAFVNLFCHTSMENIPNSYIGSQLKMLSPAGITAGVIKGVGCGIRDKAFYLLSANAAKN